MTERKKIILIVAVLLVGVVIALYFQLLFVRWLKQAPADTEPAYVESVYPEKIVYKTNENTDLDQIKKDCVERGGEFNDCGSECAGDVDLCSMRCVYACDLE